MNYFEIIKFLKHYSNDYFLLLFYYLKRILKSKENNYRGTSKTGNIVARQLTPTLITINYFEIPIKVSLNRIKMFIILRSINRFQLYAYGSLSFHLQNNMKSDDDMGSFRGMFGGITYTANKVITFVCR